MHRSNLRVMSIHFAYPLFRRSHSGMKRKRASIRKGLFFAGRFATGDTFGWQRRRPSRPRGEGSKNALARYLYWLDACLHNERYIPGPHHEASSCGAVKKPLGKVGPSTDDDTSKTLSDLSAAATSALACLKKVSCIPPQILSVRHRWTLPLYNHHFLEFKPQSARPQQIAQKALHANIIFYHNHPRIKNDMTMRFHGFKSHKCDAVCRLPSWAS